MTSTRDWRADDIPTTQLPDLTQVATGRLPDPPNLELQPPNGTVIETRSSPPLTPVQKQLAPSIQKQVERRAPSALPRSISKRDATQIRGVQEQCRKLCLTLFFREPVATRSLGFTSALAGEGKSFLSMVTAGVLAADSTE